ncbi:hypothetical protein N2152v2_002789 [Parachlorella kessleri]
MASRRGLGSLAAAISSFSRLSLTCGTPAAPSGAQQLTTLTSLRHLAQTACSPTQPAASLRQHSAAAVSAGLGPSESIEEVRARIFGTHIGNGLRSGRKVLRQKLLGPTLVSYYPEDFSRKDPFLVDMKAERAKLKLDRLKRRGKAPPKKGSGKRAGKKK